MFGASEIWNWSLRLGQVFGVEVRVHWSLLAIAVFYAFQAASRSAWILLPILIVIPFVSILLHEFGHVTAARLVGGSSNRVILWVFGGLAACQVPASPGRQFFVAAAGPLVNFLIACICLLVLNQGFSLDATAALGHGWVAFLLSYTASWNLYNLLFNLIPVYPLDGGRMLRAALWPIIGRHRAVVTTIYIAYVGVGGLMLLGGISGNLMLFAIGAMTLVSLVQEHASVRHGIDPYSDGEAHDVAASEQSVLQRWSAARARRRSLTREKEEAAEQEVLDRLLAKVSEHGLPSLTNGERKQLKQISKRQKERGD